VAERRHFSPRLTYGFPSHVSVKLTRKRYALLAGIMTVARSAELVRHRSGATGSFRSVNSRRGGIHLPALIGVGGGLLLSVQFTRSFIIPARSASQKEHCSVRPAFRPDSANKYQSRLIDADWFGFH